MIGERTNESIAMQYIHRTRAGATVEGSCDWHVNVSDEGVRVGEIWHRSDGKTGRRRSANARRLVRDRGREIVRNQDNLIRAISSAGQPVERTGPGDPNIERMAKR